MAFTQDAWFNDTYLDVFRQTLTVDVGDTTPGLFKGALYEGTVVPNFSQTGPAYDVAPWDSGEASGPGYTAGGQDLTVASFAELAGATNKISWDFADVEWTSATFEAEGLLIYAPSLTDRAFLFRWFEQTYDVADGTFSITWHADGAWRAVLRTTA